MAANRRRLNFVSCFVPAGRSRSRDCLLSKKPQTYRAKKAICKALSHPKCHSRPADSTKSFKSSDGSARTFRITWHSPDASGVAVRHI